LDESRLLQTEEIPLQCFQRSIEIQIKVSRTDEFRVDFQLGTQIQLGTLERIRKDQIPRMGKGNHREEIQA